MVYKHAYLYTLLLLHSVFMLGVVKMQLKGEVGGHGNYIVDHGKSWKNHGIMFLNFCGNPVMGRKESNQTKGQIWNKLAIMQELGKKGHFIILFIFVIVIAMSLK